MAVTPRDSETFYREVDEELRKERAARWFSRYGIAAAIGIVLLLAAIAGFLWWQHDQRRKAGENGAAFTQALEAIQAGQGKEADAKLQPLIDDGSVGYRAAALLAKADIAAQDNKNAEAVAGFKQVAENKDFPAPYRDLALIRQTGIEFDTLKPSEVIARLQPLATPGNPWFGTAGELVAAAHLKAGQPQQAAPIFAAIAKDESLPQSMRSRAVQMAGALGVDAVKEAPQSAAKE